MYQKSVHVNGYTTFISLENSTNGKYTVVIKNAFGKIREEFKVFDTGDYQNIFQYHDSVEVS